MLEKVLFLTVLVVFCECAFIIKQRSYLLLPTATPDYLPFRGTANRAAWDDYESLLYVIGEGSPSHGLPPTLHIVDVTNHSDPRVVYSTKFDVVTDGIPKAIALCRFAHRAEAVIAFSARNRLDPAYVETFNLYSKQNPTFARIDKVPLDGSDPSQVKYDRNCQHFGVTTEGLPGKRSDAVHEDPPPHFDLFSHNIIAGYHRQVTNFQNALNMERARYIYRGNAHHMFDLEPSDFYIDDLGEIFITFHENNAIAKLHVSDIVKRPAQFYGLGVKNWLDHDIDTSDQDIAIQADQINMVRRNIRSFYQPKALHGMQFLNKTYIITANTGGVKTYSVDVEGVSFAEATRATHLNNINPGLDANTLADMKDNSELGRLFVSQLQNTTDGWDPINHHFQHAHAYGGRSWSIWDSQTMNQIYDSGDSLEYQESQSTRQFFNGDCTVESLPPVALMDSRSDDMGIEPSAIATAEINGTRIVVVGSGRMGGLWVYKVTEERGHPKVVFESYIRSGDLTTSWRSLYDNQKAGLQYISDILIVNHHNHVMLIAVGSQMGALGFYEFETGFFMG